MFDRIIKQPKIRSKKLSNKAKEILAAHENVINSEFGKTNTDFAKVEKSFAFIKRTRLYRENYDSYHDYFVNRWALRIFKEIKQLEKYLAELENA